MSYIHMYAYIHIYIYTCLHIYMYTYSHICLKSCIYICPGYQCHISAHVNGPLYDASPYPVVVGRVCAVGCGSRGGRGSFPTLCGYGVGVCCAMLCCALMCRAVLCSVCYAVHVCMRVWRLYMCTGYTYLHPYRLHLLLLSVHIEIARSIQAGLGPDLPGKAKYGKAKRRQTKQNKQSKTQQQIARANLKINKENASRQNSSKTIQHSATHILVKSKTIHN